MENWMNEHDACGIGAVININGKPDNKVLDDALSIVEKLEHRAGKDASGKVGDGVGILVQISNKFFSGEAKKLGFKIGGAGDYGIGMFFLPQDSMKRMKHIPKSLVRLQETACHTSVSASLRDRLMWRRE